MSPQKTLIASGPPQKRRAGLCSILSLSYWLNSPRFCFLPMKTHTKCQRGNASNRNNLEGEENWSRRARCQLNCMELVKGKKSIKFQ
jgi:hypothetical protein